MHQLQRKIEKSDLKIIYVFALIIHVFATHIFNYNILIIIIGCAAGLISFAIAFFKLFRKPQTEKAFCLIFGIVSIFNAIVFGLYFSLLFNIELKYQALIFVFCVVIILIICFIIKNMYARSVNKRPDSPALITAWSTFGAILGVLLTRFGIIPKITRTHLLFGLAIILFSIFSVFLFKSRDCE